MARQPFTDPQMSMLQTNIIIFQMPCVWIDYIAICLTQLTLPFHPSKWISLSKNVSSLQCTNIYSLWNWISPSILRHNDRNILAAFLNSCLDWNTNLTRISFKLCFWYLDVLYDMWYQLAKGLTMDTMRHIPSISWHIIPRDPLERNI